MGPGVDHRDHGGPGQAKDIPFVLGDTDGLGRKKSNQSLGQALTLSPAKAGEAGV
jgi:hypothetical protein